MSNNTPVNPTNWIREYTFQEFVKLNPHIINENQLIILYNQYLHKFLEEQNQKKINFKQSKTTQLLTEFKELQQTIAISTPGGGGSSDTKRNYVLTFAGDTEDDYVLTTFNPDNYDGTGTGLNHGFTVSFWIKPAEIGGFLQPLGRRSETNGRFHFGIKSATLVHVGVGQSTVKSDNTHNGGVSGGHGMTAGNWYNVVVTYGGDDHSSIGGDKHVRMWINGNAITKTGASGGGLGTANWQPSWTNTVNAASNIYLGARTDHNGLPGDPYSQGWACSLSEVAIYKEEKDDDGTFANEVYNGGFNYDHRNNSNLVGYWRLDEGSGTTATDLSGNGNHGTLTTDGTALPTWTPISSY